jgi:hypothetical protein
METRIVKHVSATQVLGRSDNSWPFADTEVSLPRSQKLSMDPTMDQVCINFTRYHTIGQLGQRSV